MGKHNKANIFKICIGIYFIASVFYAYYGGYDHLYELTAISNFINGAVLIACGTANILGKRLDLSIRLMPLICIMCVYTTVFMVAFKIAKFNFEGGFMLLHGVNPLIALCFFVFSDRYEIKSKKERLLRIFTAPLLFMAYLLFDLVFYFINGSFVYELLSSDCAYLAPVVAVIMYGMLAFMGYGLIDLKMFVQGKLTDGSARNTR